MAEKRKTASEKKRGICLIKVGDKNKIDDFKFYQQLSAIHMNCFQFEVC